ncbi:MAG: type II toxin-antitoxin system RelE/ParE family toxin [Phycisphaerales bacterium]|nr:type II toxin-antitoxin system RelE/ParE family toxin [Phycisphaerales bacterium]
MYDVVLSREASRVYATVDPALARKLARCFTRLETSPRSGGNVKSLKGQLAGLFRYRVGDHRVVYSIDDSIKLVTVITIARRRDVYD